MWYHGVHFIDTSVLEEHCYPEGGGRSFLQNGIYPKQTPWKWGFTNQTSRPFTSAHVASHHLAFSVDPSVTEDALHTHNFPSFTHTTGMTHFLDALHSFETRKMLTRLHSVTSQKTWILSSTTVDTSCLPHLVDGYSRLLRNVVTFLPN